jgi:methionyl-tRNA synthetase
MTDLQNNIGNVLNTLQQAKEYADRAVDSANEAEIQASEAHTQAIEARDLIERAMEWLDEI